MIIVSLFGGLGNQMFQYACGISIAKKLGTELKLDISYLEDRTHRENYTFRDFELRVFNVDVDVATTKEIRRFIPDLWNSSRVIKGLYRFKCFFNGNHYYREKHKFVLENRFRKVKDNTYLYGYFQTEKYFSDFKEDIFKYFQLKNKPDDINAALIETLQSENSVSVHIRRGDYTKSPFTLLDVDFYKKAIELILQKVENPKFYFFTNDIEWVEENFASFHIDKTFVKHNQAERSYMDMVLMSNCKHNICANSSFSWWGGWLNQNSDKIVITPKKWFKEDFFSDFELIPPTWLKL